jgi:hypothetical protein
MKPIKQIKLFYLPALFAILVVLVMFSPSWAATYYVDATDGNNNNDGLSQSTAWKTIAKVNSSIFQPGDAILFKRGETWREQLRVPSSGREGNPITFSAYGSGDKPVIKGSDIIAIWSIEGSYVNLRKATVNTEPFAVWEDGSRLTKQTSRQNVEDNTGSWYWNANILYVRSSSGIPGSNSKEYEACQRINSVMVPTKSYLTFDNLEIVEGGNTTSGVQFYVSAGSSNLTIQSCDFSRSATKHISLWALDGDAWIRDCSFSYTGECRIPAIGYTWSAIWIGTASPSNHTVTVERSRFEHIADYIGDQYQSHGIYVTGGRLVYRYNYHLGGVQSGAAVRMAGNVKDGCEIYYNLITGGDAWNSWGIYNANGSGHLVYNNVFFNVSRVVIQDSGPNGNGNGITAKNNIFYLKNIGHKIFDITSNLDTFVSDYNVFFIESEANFTFFWDQNYISGLDNWMNVSGQDTHSKNANPFFKNLSVKDFSLQATSPCIDAGTNLGLTLDFNGNLVPRGEMPDIGTFEYGGLAAPKNLHIY